MPTTTKTFIYTGTINKLVIPAGTTSIDVHLLGGAGGGGSSDAGGPGGYGAAGHYVTATGISLTSNIGDTLQVTVGGGGGGGSSGGGAPGGGAATAAKRPKRTITIINSIRVKPRFANECVLRIGPKVTTEFLQFTVIYS